MNYFELRNLVKDIIPRTNLLFPRQKNELFVRHKGRKKNYKQYNLLSGKWETSERLLNKEEIRSFIEVSCRAEECPMPLNLDVWDGLVCPYGCIYCFANYWRETLYNNLFDNPKEIGLRSARPEEIIKQLDSLMKMRGKKPEGNEVQRAIAIQLPIRFGIRFEDFLPIERKKEVSLRILQYLSETEYPVMINTKSCVISEDKYLRALSENNAGSAVHITLITNDLVLSRKLEPGSPLPSSRWESAKALIDSGIRVVMRIEPYMAFINDTEEEVSLYIAKMKEIGCEHITFDTYSYSATNQAIKGVYEQEGLDYYRMQLLTSDSQWLGSLLLSKYMELFRKEGIKCSTFDFGSVSDNDDHICCNVGDWFGGAGYSYGNSLSAVRFIRDSERPVNWSDFVEFVNDRGGFLSEALYKKVHLAWNLGDPHNAYTVDWGRGIHCVGQDKDGNLTYNYINDDFRLDLLKGVLG